MCRRCLARMLNLNGNDVVHKVLSVRTFLDRQQAEQKVLEGLVI